MPWQSGHQRTYQFHGQEYRLQYLDLTTIPVLQGEFNLDRALRAIAAQTDVREIFAHAVHAARSMGFPTVTYGMLLKTVEGAPILIVSTPLPLEVWEASHHLGLMDMDEAVLHAGMRRIPGVWRLENSRMQELGPALLAEWAKFCSSRVVVPLYGPTEANALMAFNSLHPAIDEHLGDRLTGVMMTMHFLATHVHEQICSIGMWNALLKQTDSESSLELTGRQQDVLILLSKGNTVAQVATLTGVTDATVSYHIQKLKRLLHATTIPELVTKATDLGIVRARTLQSSYSVNLSPYAPGPKE